MNKLYRLIIFLVMVSMASAAVYVATNPEAFLSFTRDKPTPSPGDSTVLTMFECGEGYASNCDMGTMSTNVLDRQIYHQNTYETAFDGVVYFEISCTEGLGLGTNGGIRDFNTITFTDPHGNTTACNNGECIERIDTNTIKITPTTNVFSFVYDVVTYTNINIEFDDNAYGDYAMTAYVDAVPTT